MKDYKYNVNELYENTNDGLDIIHKYIPGSVGLENTSKKFVLTQIREERTASACLFKTNVSWIVKDFGGESYNPVDLVMKITGFDFLTTLKNLYAEFHVNTSFNPVKANITFKANKENFPKSYFRINLKEDYENLNRFGPFVSPKIAMMYNVHEIASYTKVTAKEGKLMTVEATKDYPIFCYSSDLKKGAKLYNPAEYKRKDENGKTINYKHGYLGEKEASYIHGLDRILSDVEEKTIKELYNSLKSTSSSARKEILDKIKGLQVKNIIICSGGSDGLNLASISNDYYPIWFNSESEQLSYQQYQRINKLCNNFYNLPDVDTSGIKYAHKLSNRYWNLKTIWLPKKKLGSKGKDFRDWMKCYSKADQLTLKRQFEKLKNVALQCNFIDKNSNNRPRVNLANFHYFLNANNYYSYKPDYSYLEKNNDDTSFLIKIDEYKVSIPESSEVRKFCIDFLIDKGADLDKINLIKQSKFFNSNELKTIDRIQLDFKNFDADTQYFYFNNSVVSISADDIKNSTSNINGKYVWSHKIVDKNIRIEDSYFKYYKDEEGNNRVKILDKSCDFMCYLINASRVFWRKEIEEPFKTVEKQEKYRKEHLFTLNGNNLSNEEQMLQEQHFLNKCFAVGYMLHRYKREDFAKFVYIMDDAVKSNNSEANGGTGKSLLIRGLKELLSIFNVDGRDKNLVTDKHLLGELRPEHDVINIEDGLKGFAFNYFYNKVTSDIQVNPKNRSGYSIPFADAQKLVGTFNYGLSNNNGSDLRRILFVSFSNYYHSLTDEFTTGRKVSDDFGYSFFQNWNETHYNKFYNFLFQCCQLYLQNRNNEFKAPMDNINQNNIISQIGDNFIEWASEYFIEDAEESNFNKNIPRKELYNTYMKDIGTKMAMGKNRFKSSLEKFCQFKGYEFNPLEYRNSQGRISINVTIPNTQKRTKVECFHIRFRPDPEVNVNTNGLKY